MKNALTRAATPLAGLLLAATLAQAAPFVPARDDEVVQTLRATPGGSPAQAAERRARRAAQAALQAHPQDLPLALQAARRAIDEARARGDPRALGQARAALAPWWAQPAPPAPARLLRATVLQSEHAFDAALADLGALVADAAAPLPLRAQALLTQASVWQVQGHLAQAAEACGALAGPGFAALGPAAALPARVCEAELRSLLGEPQAARAQLAALARGADPSQAAWLALVRAELAERLGDPEAQALYRHSLPGGGVYALGAYADWLLDQGRPREVLRLLAGRDAADALLLRRAEALQALGDPDTAAAVRTLGERFDALRLRGELTHRREEARFALRLRHDAPRALALAQANWAVQREPADARLLLEAARATGRPDAAQPVRDFLRETGAMDRRLEAALRQETAR